MNAQGNQIRVVSLDPAVTTDVTDDLSLRCTLEEVDLDDWTEDYQAFKADFRPEAILVTNKSCLMQWHFRSAPPHTLVYEDAWRARVDTFILRLQHNNDLSFEGVEAINARFNWGDYIALSYVWGDPRNLHEIELNGQRFSITSNLYQALLCLWKSFEIQQLKLDIWIDAIYVNQEDLDERAAQVKKMGAIYSQPLAVRAFLGQAPPEIAIDLQTLRGNLQILGHNKQPGVRCRLWDIEDSLCRAISYITCSPYWTRLWTMQEIALAPSILYQSGQQLFSTRELLECVRFLQRYLRKSFTKCANDFDLQANTANAKVLSMRMNRLFRLRPPNDPQSKEEGFKLVDIIRLAMQSNATDLRYIVYGILALLPTEIAVRIHPNYDQFNQYPDVFVEFSRACFQALGNIDLLTINQPSPFEGFPSWALCLIDYDGLHQNIESEIDSGKHAANSGMRKAEIGFSENNRLMYCTGAIVDTFSLSGGSQSEVELPVNTCDATQQQSRDPARFTSWEWKRSLARVSHRDPNFEFSDLPSVLDIPWLEVDELEGDGHIRLDSLAANAFIYDSLDEFGMLFERFSRMTRIRLFWVMLGQDQDIIIGGRPLRSYFTSTDELCHDSKEFAKLARKLINSLDGRRLCVTGTGLFGLVPRLSQLGNKIAVFSQCQMPVVLRPKGEFYKIIGMSFVEGLMKGEVAEGIEQGRFHIEKICLC